ncbi:MAG TPA: TonB-dependent receptor [Blastocatellia bacterium]|nr:TonB-dependent receptor [Blastocatellia bacterium]
MNRVFSILIIGGLFLATSAISAPHSTISGTVEAAPALGFISGTVRNDSGAPLTGATVALFEAGLNGKLVKSLMTDPQGKFTTGLAPGSYTLRAEAAGYRAKLTRINLDRAEKLTFNLALRRSDTLVEKRGDREDYRWIGRSVPRSILHYDEEEEIAANTAPQDKVEDRLTRFHPSFHGVAQFIGTSSASRGNQAEQNFFGSNFAVSGSLNGNFEVALIGQGGAGNNAPQRLGLIATMRPDSKHQITTSIGYGRLALLNRDAGRQSDNSLPTPSALEQASISVVDSWQVFQPLLLVYGVDYSRFVGSAGRNRESILPRVAIQYAPASNTQLRVAVTPGKDFTQNPAEGLNTENINAETAPEAAFEPQPDEVAFSGSTPLLDNSRRYEFGIRQLFGDGSSALEATAFYDVISGHGVGVLALPLEATPETEAAFHRVAAMNGATRGIRVLYSRHLSDHLTASVGYSFGRGERLNRAFNSSDPEAVSPAQLFTGGFFQVASARLDLDLSKETGTNISTVIRLSPSAVVFAIDPFAGRMSVYDPNVSVYITQELPTFGLPLRCQAIIDVRNLLNQAVGTEEGTTQLVAARSGRTVRGGIAFRW